MVLKVCILVCLVIQAQAQKKVSVKELQSFSAQKHRVDYKAQKTESKKQLLRDYAQTLRLSDAILKGDLRNDVDYQIALRLLAITTWAKKVTKDAKVSEKTLKVLYKKHSLRVEAKYQLRNILVMNEKQADKIIKRLSKISRNAKRFREFKKLVKIESEDFITRKKAGKLGWFDVRKLSPAMKKALKDKKTKSIAKVHVDGIGWQVIFIEDYKEEKVATFKEAKPILEKYAKQEILAKEIENILK